MNRIEQFSEYLTKRGFQPRTINSYGNKLRPFVDWCNRNQLLPENTSLENLYAYKRECLEQGLQIGTVRERLTVVKHYFQSINREDNPALLVKHKKRTTTLPPQLLSEEELKELYRNIEAKTFIQRRDKVMLGLVIFQGLKREELDMLEVHHLNFDEADIYVPSSTKTNARNIPLNPIQLPHLMAYIYEYRPKLLREANRETERLFVSMGKGNSMTNALQFKVQSLKRTYPSFKTLTQVRESRMAIWIKEHGIRKAQYFSGIKYVSSMLRYKTADIEKLKQKLSVVHPMERLKLGL